jgi:hypothetical protein
MSAWANTPDGQRAYEMEKAGSLHDLVNHRSRIGAQGRVVRGPDGPREGHLSLATAWRLEAARLRRARPGLTDEISPIGSRPVGSWD